MAAFPAMPLYSDAYLADTRHLTTEEHGAYLLLLMCAWRARECRLADDDKSLARITGLSPTRWRRMRPVLEQFFEIRKGFWQQKKLTAVYEEVAARVARNRANGARGGHATASARKHVAGAKTKPLACNPNDDSEPPDGGETPAETGSESIATKAKTKPKAASCSHKNRNDRKNKNDKSKQPEPADEARESAGYWHERISTVCGPDAVLDVSIIQLWLSAGVDLEADALPTIRQVRQRELVRTGEAPKRLSYYKAAVLDALAVRQAAIKAGRSHALQSAVPQHEKQIFNPADSEHWRRLLGDNGSRFRGDYMAQNWFIPADHPDFREQSLGPNPKFMKNPALPGEIYQHYARAWCWR